MPSAVQDNVTGEWHVMLSCAQSLLHNCASIHVDGVETRLSVLEGQLVALQNENAELKSELSQQQNENENNTAALEGQLTTTLYFEGLSNIYRLTNSGNYSLRVDLQDFNGTQIYAVYDNFRIDGADQKYTLHISGYHGNAAKLMYD
nr:hypothetical protein BaRGS_003677 [Batillaria attramentaria]